MKSGMNHGLMAATGPVPERDRDTVAFGKDSGVRTQSWGSFLLNGPVEE